MQRHSNHSYQIRIWDILNRNNAYTGFTDLTINERLTFNDVICRVQILKVLQHSFRRDLVSLLYEYLFIVLVQSHLEVIVGALFEVFDICHLSAIVAHLHFEYILTNCDSVHQILKIDRSFRKAFLWVVTDWQNAPMSDQLEFDKYIFRKLQ